MDDAIDPGTLPAQAVNVFPFARNGTWMLCDRSGQETAGNRFDLAARGTEGLAAVAFASKRSLVDRLAGRAPRYTWGYANAEGTVVIEPRFQACGYFSNGLAPVKAGEQVPDQCRPGNVGFIDPAGNWVIPPRYGDARQFTEGLAPVYMGPTRMWGFMDTARKFVILPRFNEVCSFSEGLAAVCNGRGIWGFIDASGEWVVRPLFKRTQPFANGLAPAMPGSRDESFIDRPDRWGYVTSNGTWAIEPQFTRACPFSEGLALVTETSGAHRYIRPDGTTAFEVDATRVPYSFSGGLAPFARPETPDTLAGYLDAQGSAVAW